jgi:membrane protease YdiL (CAAX protease family)
MTRRQRTALALVALSGALAVWAVTDELAVAARLWCAVLLALLPAAMLAQGAQTGQTIRSVPRASIYISSALTLWALCIATLLVANAGSMTRSLLGLRGIDALSLLGWTALTISLALGAMASSKLLHVRESSVVRLIVPRDRADALPYSFLCVSAGVCEEITYRGFLIPSLTAALGSIWLVAALSSAAFGVLHSYQNTWGAVRAGVLGFVLAIPFIITGSLLPSILAHTAIDLLAGFTLRDWLLPPETPATASADVA